MPRAQSFAVNDAHAAPLPQQRLSQEFAQRLLRLGHREAMKVDFPLDPVVAAAQLAQQARLNARTVEDELLAAGEPRIDEVLAQAFLEHRKPVGPAEASDWTRT